MNGGLVPMLLLALTLGLVLGFTTLRSLAIALILFLISGFVGHAIPVLLPLEGVFVGLFISVIATASLVYLPIRKGRGLVIALAINAGLWSGACAASTSTTAGLAIGMLPALAAIPAHWIVRRRFDIVIKVVASWMIAISALSLFVSLVPTPGYKPDHME